MTSLIAGFGNIFLCDDGFGNAVVRELAGRGLGECVRLRDFGTGGMHLALDMLENYDLVVIADAIARPEPAGTLFAIDCSQECRIDQTSPDAHAMTVGAVLALYARLRDELGSPRQPRIIVAGCVPQNLEQGMDLSEPVRAAVPACADLILKLVRQSTMTGAQT